MLNDTSERRRRQSQFEAESSILFGGHPLPKLDVPYQATTNDKKEVYHAISMMKVSPSLLSVRKNFSPI